MSDETTLKDLANEIAGDIPSEWVIRIEIGRHCGSVILTDPGGDEHEVLMDDGVETAARRALARAIAEDPAWADETDPGDP